ncbi:MAG: M3 family metallopeptidase, partial [Lachnospiraceae bacterium]
ETLCGIYRELNEMYFGPDMVVDDYIALEWARIPHFYTPFYVYQYATGFSAAIALSTKILEEGETAVENYKKFLKGGSSMDPIELLKVAGVDMTSAEPIQKALDVFDDVITQMEEICLK